MPYSDNLCGRLILLVLLGIAGLLVPACRQQNTGGKVEGTVLDTAGKPVAEVRVFNSGDGPKPIETRSDALGRFRLDGLNSSPTYVFAEKADYRFAGIRTTAGATDVAIELLKQTEPAPRRAAASKPMPLDQQQKLARGMLEKLRADDPRGKRYPGVAMAMSRIDPELALRWSAESGPGGADIVRITVADKIADDDLDEAISLIGQSGAMGLNMLSRLARRYVVSDHAKAMRCAEELVVKGRAVDQPWRAAYLAEAGSVVIQSGNKDAGWRLLDEAGGMAAKLGHDGLNVFPRGIVARAMAPSDLKRALALLEPASLGVDRDRFLGNVAMAICLEKLDAALEIATKFKSPNDADRARLRIAYRLAPTRASDAIRVVETIPTEPQVDSGKVRKAVAFGWIAEAIAPHDKPLACSLIDQAYALLMSPGTAESSRGTYGGWPARAAFLAVQAQRIGYPDMESIVYRALACRPMREYGAAPARAMESIQSQIFMAAFLGLVDSRAAKHILDSIDSQIQAAISGLRATDRAVWLKAWLLADAKRGQAIFEEALAAIRNKPGTDEEFHSLVDVAWLLAASPQEKSQHILNAREFCPPYDEE